MCASAHGLHRYHARCTREARTDWAVAQMSPGCSREKTAGACRADGRVTGSRNHRIETPTGAVSALPLDRNDQVPTLLSFPTVHLSRCGNSPDMSFADSVFLGPSSPPSSHLHFSMGSPSPLDHQDQFTTHETHSLHDLSRSGSPPQPPLDSLVSALGIIPQQLRNAF